MADDRFADDLARALRAPGPAPRTRRRSTRPEPPPERPARTGPAPTAPSVLRNRSFNDLFNASSEEPPVGDAWAPPSADPAGRPTGTTVMVRDDPVTGVLELHAGAPGPAGEATLDLAGGVTICVDAAAPRRLTSLALDRLDAGGIDGTLLPSLLHPMLGQVLRRRPVADGEWHPAELADPAATDVEALGRFVLLADEADRTTAGGPADEAGPLPRLALLTEALTHVPRSLRGRLGPAPSRWARLAAALLHDAEETGLLGEVADEHLHELANGARAAAQVLASVEGPTQLEDRRAGRRVGALANRLDEGALEAAPGEGPGGSRPPDGTGGDRADLEAPTASLVAAGELEITVTPQARDELERWAVVRRAGDPTPVAVAPLAPADPDDPERPRACRIPIPCDVTAAEVTVEVTADPAAPPASPVRERLAEAIAAGRQACRLERRGDSAAAARAWHRCAAHWESLGDGARAEVARRYAEGSHPGQVAPFLADRLAGA